MLLKVQLQRPKTNFWPSTRSQVCETKTQCAHVLHQTKMTTDTVHSSAEGNANITVEIRCTPCLEAM